LKLVTASREQKKLYHALIQYLSGSYRRPLITSSNYP